MEVGMRVLGIETSGPIGGFAVVEDGQVLAETVSRIMGSHVEKCTGMIEQVLDRASVRIDDLDGVAVSIGPGSFTGLRVGLAVGKGICFGKDRPLVGVPTLDCIAEPLSYWKGLVVPVRDARRGEIYFGVYRSAGGSVTRISGYLALPPGLLPERIGDRRDDSGILLAGDGLVRYGDLLRSGLEPRVEFAAESFWTPKPSVVAILGSRLLNDGQVLDTGSAEPMYIRPSEAERSALGTAGDGDPRDKKNDR
jgi:tRNA threonylcarbamoyladenosine biosynthesis protein TsaB